MRIFIREEKRMDGTNDFNAGKTALITGASRGLGYELCRLLAEDGYNLILIARDRERLRRAADEFEKAYGVAVKTMVKDLSLPEASREIYETLKQESVQVDILVNNAGFGMFGRFVNSDPAGVRALLEVNITALTLLTRLFLKDMISRRRGRIMNVASLGAYQAGPFMATYYASKAYVLSFTESLGNELAGTGVTVTAFCPGRTRTEFDKTAGVKKLKWLDDCMMDAGKAAQIGYKALMKGKRIVISGWQNRLIAYVSRLLPRKLVNFVVMRMPEKMT